METIVKHPNYAGLPWAIDKEGKIRWNAPSYRPPGGPWSNLHDERFKWWKTKAKELGIPLTGNYISAAAKMLHPFKEKPCQICGRTLSLKYEYPTMRTIDRVNRIPGISAPFNHRDLRPIQEVVKEVYSQAGEKGLQQVCLLLGIPQSQANSLPEVLEFLEDELIPREPRGVLSPGAMSDAPDRLDGFHTYNICCRSAQDTGRRRENLKTYLIDRRAFEYWCEGDWAAADYLMKQTINGVCPGWKQPCGAKGPLTADHVGPLSLGFCHRPRFRALCKACNSARNNKLSLNDVRILIEDEKKGEEVVSWQAKSVWDIYKDKIKSDSDALYLAGRP